MDPARYVLCRVVPACREDGSVTPIESQVAAKELETLQSLVTPEHFPKPYREFYRLFERWFLLYGGTVPDRELFLDMVSREGGKLEEEPETLLALYLDLSALETEDAKRSYCLKQLQEDYETERLDAILRETARINLTGTDIQGETLKGPDAAKEHLFARITVIERGEVGKGETDARDPADLVASYLAAETAEGVAGRGYIPTGYRYYDERTTGGKRKELWVWLAWKGHGKSMQMVNLAVNAVVLQGKNCLYATGEMAVEDIKRRVYACHSWNPKFRRTRGLQTREIEEGRLDPIDREIFLDWVVPDFETNADYGKLHLFSMPPGCTVESVYSRAKRYSTQFPVDVLFIDYLGLLHSGRKRQSDREEIDDKMQALKQMAMHFGDGEGVWVVTASQPSKEQYLKALEKGHYDLTGFRGSSEIAFSADVTAYLLRTEESRQQHEIVAGILSNRRGLADEQEGVRFMEDFASAYLGDPQVAAA